MTFGMMSLTRRFMSSSVLATGTSAKATTHRERGADLVPVVFAVDGDHLAIPIDTVKPKAAGRLQRERNLAADPRAALLIEHWAPLTGRACGGSALASDGSAKTWNPLSPSLFPPG